jgi:predicted Zn-dependent protease with MMP-like domain
MRKLRVIARFGAAGAGLMLLVGVVAVGALVAVTGLGPWWLRVGAAVVIALACAVGLQLERRDHVAKLRAYAQAYGSTGGAGLQEDTADADEFTALVDRAIRSIPEPFAATLENVAVVIEEEPPEGLDYLGLYTGVPLPHRNRYPSLPDRITIYRGPLERQFGGDEAELERWVRHIVLHEVAHHFGISDRRLAEIGRYYPADVPQPDPLRF